MYRHTGLLSKDQRELGPQCRDIQDLDLNLRGEVGPMYRHSELLFKGQKRGGMAVYSHSGPLSKDQRRVGIRCSDTQDFYTNVRGELRPQCTDIQGLNL